MHMRTLFFAGGRTPISQSRKLVGKWHCKWPLYPGYLRPMEEGQIPQLILWSFIIQECHFHLEISIWRPPMEPPWFGAGLPTSTKTWEWTTLSLSKALSPLASSLSLSKLFSPTTSLSRAWAILGSVRPLGFMWWPMLLVWMTASQLYTQWHTTTWWVHAVMILSAIKARS